MIDRELRALHELARTNKRLLVGQGAASLGFLTGAAYVLLTGFERADHADGLRHAYEATHRHDLPSADADAFIGAALAAIEQLLDSYRGAA